MVNTQPFQTIRQTAKTTGLSEYYLRNQVKEGKIPGVYSGTRFRVNVPALLEQLRERGGN